MCAVELSQSTEAVPDLTGAGGRFQCPACHGKFDQWTSALHPANARWYVPQDHKPTCPRCAAPLEWKRLPEPPQLPQDLQGIALGTAWALWSTVPPALNQWIKTQLGWGFVILTPLALIALFFLAVRPAMWTTAGQGTGHFVLSHSTGASRRKPWMTLLSIVGFAGCYWATPQDHRLTVWAAGFGLAMLGCILAVVWRIRTEQRLRRSAP